MREEVTSTHLFHALIDALSGQKRVAETDLTRGVALAWRSDKLFLPKDAGEHSCFD